MSHCFFSFFPCGQMDRASILGDAIDYLKELLQRINDLHNELESTPSSYSLPASTSFHPLTPTPLTLPSRVKEELCPSSLPSPNSQPARVNWNLLAPNSFLLMWLLTKCYTFVLTIISIPSLSSETRWYAIWSNQGMTWLMQFFHELFRHCLCKSIAFNWHFLYHF